MSPFIRKKTAFFSCTPNFFGPSYFEAALHDASKSLVPLRLWDSCGLLAP